MIIQDILEGQIKDRLAAALPDLCETTVWDGAWDKLASPKRHSLPELAAFVSLTGLTLGHRGQQGFDPRQLQRSDLPPPCPQARIDVAVTFVSAAPEAECRAMEVLNLAEAAVPVLIEAAFEDIRGTNLYGKALYEAGMSAFALLGGRLVELAPELPAAVSAEEACLRGPGGLVGAVRRDG